MFEFWCSIKLIKTNLSAEGSDKIVGKTQANSSHLVSFDDP